MKLDDISEVKEQLNPEIKKNREPEYPILPLFLNRWSPRAMTGESLEDEDFMPLFEAARWAPSSYNNQSWRFIYATRESESWESFLSLLNEGNQSWCKDGSVLVLIASKTTFDHNGEESRTHSFDSGAAWQNLALEGARRNLVVHGLEGFDYEKARNELNIPEKFDIEAMVVIGKKGSENNLSEELMGREKPSSRKDIEKIISENEFNF
jgi:nitroreductase